MNADEREVAIKRLQSARKGLSSVACEVTEVRLRYEAAVREHETAVSNLLYWGINPKDIQ